MDYKRNLLLFTNQIEKKIIFNGKEWKIKFEINFNFFLYYLYITLIIFIKKHFILKI